MPQRPGRSPAAKRPPAHGAGPGPDRRHAGGLCRAYTKAAKDALDDAGISELRPWSVLRLDCPYALFDRVKLELEKRGGLLRDTDYGAEIAMTVLLPEPEEAAFAAALRELSAGSLRPERTGTELHGVKIR